MWCEFLPREGAVEQQSEMLSLQTILPAPHRRPQERITCALTLLDLGRLMADAQIWCIYKMSLYAEESLNRKGRSKQTKQKTQQETKNPIMCIVKKGRLLNSKIVTFCIPAKTFKVVLLNLS